MGAGRQAEAATEGLLRRAVDIAEAEPRPEASKSCREWLSTTRWADRGGGSAGVGEVRGAADHPLHEPRHRGRRGP
eukprot:3331803-Rhodomonas_salina.2